MQRRNREGLHGCTAGRVRTFPWDLNSKMSRVAQTFIQDEIGPISEYQVIGRNVSALGNSIFQLEVSDYAGLLKAQLPQRFNKLVWFAKNSFCVATLPCTVASFRGLPEEDARDTLAAIDVVLVDANILQLSNENRWPPAFESYVPVVRRTADEPDALAETDNHNRVFVDETSSSESYY